ncbi:M56 family metallopeptidase [Clostridium estertheticum]|uniref:M56 family metallopeptidase n=1 Tax=Clostridium estertheticum TaxID=238834 RepID=UPI001C0CD087|nr:M56 family metallopeptidase [Clostridium estertheticum]MBU3184897.1 M56 family metallopeptidase [Clostridium estertheticum]
MLEKFIANIIYTSLTSSIAIVILLILRKGLLKKYTKNFIYYIWLLIIVKLFIPFRIAIYISPKIYDIFGSFINTITFDKSENKVSLYQSNIITKSSNHNNISIINIISYIWIIGVLSLTIYYICMYIKLIKNIKYFTYDVNNNEILSIYTELMRDLKINKKICLKYYKGITSPFGMGFLKPCIVIPHNSCNSTEMRLILCHELTHFKKHDLFYKMGLIIVKILYWFNPLVYVMCNLINYDCELACDESLLKCSGVEERKLYAMTFVNSLRSNNIFEKSLITGFNKNRNKNMLKRRLESMLNLNIKRSGVLIGSLSAIIISSSLLSVNVFAQKNTKSTIASVNSDRKTSVGKLTESQLAFLKQHKGNILVRPSNPNASVVNFTVYTYANAPANIKANHEANCKSVNVKPTASDEILIPIK